MNETNRLFAGSFEDSYSAQNNFRHKQRPHTNERLAKYKNLQMKELGAHGTALKLQAQALL
jgi:hypothetical protein